MPSERTYGIEVPKRPGELNGSNAQTSVPNKPQEPPEPPEPSEPSETIEAIDPTEPLEPLEANDSSKYKCVESKNPFEFSGEGLLIAEGHVNGTKARILIDSGAVLNHISAEFCEKHNIKLQQETSHVGVMANKVEQKLCSTISDVKISIGPYTERMRLVSNPQSHDVT